jgi:hypothetical protein
MNVNAIDWVSVVTIAGPLFVLGWLSGWYTATLIGSAFKGRTKK